MKKCHLEVASSKPKALGMEFSDIHHPQAALEAATKAFQNAEANAPNGQTRMHAMHSIQSASL